MSNLLQPLVDILKFTTLNLTNGLADITNEAALKRVLGGCPNSLTHVVCHIIGSRYDMGKLAGLNEEFPWQDIFKTESACTDGENYPDIEEVRQVLQAISEKLISRLESLSDEEALAETPNAFPMQEKTVRGGLAFLIWHDSYHLGQVGAIRTTLKVTPLKDLFHS